jgi:Flp pilus assembly protein TadD
MQKAGTALRRIASAVFASAALALIPAAAGSATAEIERLIEQDRLDEAIAAAREAVVQAPDDPDIHMALAQALATQGRDVMPVVTTEIDAADLTSGQHLLPFPRPGENTEIDVVYDRDLFEEALSEVRKAIRLAPQRIDLRYSEGYLLTDAGEIQKAAAAILRTIESGSDRAGLASILLSYGNERVVRGDPAGGATLLGVVAKAFPDDMEVLAAYGTALAQAGRRDEALERLDRAAELGLRDREIQRQKGVVSLLFQDFGRAHSAYLRAHMLSRDPADHFGVAASQFGLDPKSSLPDFEELASLTAVVDPDGIALAREFLRAISRPEYRIELARALVADQRGLLAIPVLARMLDDDPDHAEARGLMARIYHDTGFPLP